MDTKLALHWLFLTLNWFFRLHTWATFFNSSFYGCFITDKDIFKGNRCNLIQIMLSLRKTFKVSVIKMKLNINKLNLNTNAITRSLDIVVNERISANWKKETIKHIVNFWNHLVCLYGYNKLLQLLVEKLQFFNQNKQ